MDVATTPALASSGAALPETTIPKKTVASDFDTFLQMLTTQMRYQDPLNPIDSTDFAAQLATFSAVEQQQLTNQLLEDMSSQLGLSGMAQLATWVGKEARAPVAAVFDGTPVTLSAAPDPRAKETTLIVSDAAGTVMSRQTVPVGTEPFEWAGATADGGMLPPGLYSFSLESSADGEILGTTPVEVYARIIEAQAGKDGTILVMEGGVQVLAEQVTALRGE